MYARVVQRATPTSQVRTVMMWPVATIEGGATLAEVAEALTADEVGALCVTEDGRLAGIVSERDVVVHLATGADPARLTAAEMMSPDLVTASPQDSLLVAARKMTEAQVRHLPVLDDGVVTGIVSIRDLVTVLADDAADPAVVGGTSGGPGPPR